MSKSLSSSGGGIFDGFIGDIQTSMLTEAQFQSQRGSGWILCDGRSVGGSKYASLTGVSVVPDVRGKFLRAKNNGRVDGQQNPDGDLALGASQTDVFGSHTHVQSAHNHGLYVYSAAGTQIISTNNYISNQTNGNSAIAGPTIGTTNTTTIANATATNQNTGGNETRPKNVTVNYFIKIN